jgi:hypothetical protein
MKTIAQKATIRPIWLPWLYASDEPSFPYRVTRMGEFSDIGRLFSLGSFFEKYNRLKKFGLSFLTVKVEQ